MKTRLTIIAVCTLVIFALAPILGGAAESKYSPVLGDIPTPSQEYRIGVLVKTLINDFWLDLANGYKDAGAEYGVTVDVYAAPSEGDILVQKQILDDMIAKQYDVLCVSPITDTNLIAPLKKATDQGIPIINVIDSYISPEAQEKHGIEIATFITTDFVEHTKSAVEFVAETLGDEGGEIMHIMGLPGNPSAEERKQGYLEAVAEYPQLTDIGVWPGDWDRKKSMDVAADVLQSHPNLRAIVGANDTIALGALQAVKNAGKQDQVVVAGVDAIPDAIRSIMDGELLSTVAFFQYQTAYTAVEVALQILEGTFDESNKQLKLDQEVWHAGNIEEKIEAYRDQYTGLKDF